VVTEPPRWLTPDQQKAWITFNGVLIKLPYALDADLRKQAGFSHFEYLVMSVLSEPDDRTLQMSQLAALTNASLSRLSHVITRLEQKGWATRCPSAENGRITTARLTDAGFTALASAAPGHVETVQRLVFDALTPAQVEQLAEISDQILDRLDPGGEWPPRAS
jgi:DNA-binding MarR family transcriptional regulator